MRRRIARTIVGVAALVIVVLGVPFAVFVQRFYESRATVELQRSAAEAIVELQVPLRVPGIAEAVRELGAPDGLTVYDAAGRRLYGPGPDRVDDPQPDRLVVISPITARRTEVVEGSVRVSRPRSEIAAQVRWAWLWMAVISLGALAVAWLAARREAARLAAPITDLADRARALGLGEFEVSGPPIGVAELDALSEALSLSGYRLADLVARERRFSANAAHQLRTPLAALRMNAEHGDLSAVRVEVERVASIVEHMLALARNVLPQAEPVDIGTLVLTAGRRWQNRYAEAGRVLDLSADEPLPAVRGRPASIDQAVDILLDNSLRHATGTTRVAVRSVAGGVVVTVDDDGPGLAPDRASAVFDDDGTSPARIGLPLARTLVEADGGRLVLSDPGRAEFRLVFAGPPSAPEPG